MIYSHHSGIKTQKLVYLQAWLKKFYWIPHSQPILVSIKQLVTIRCPWQPLTGRACPGPPDICVPVTPPLLPLASQRRLLIGCWPVSVSDWLRAWDGVTRGEGLVSWLSPQSASECDSHQCPLLSLSVSDYCDTDPASVGAPCDTPQCYHGLLLQLTRHVPAAIQTRGWAPARSSLQLPVLLLLALPPVLRRGGGSRSKLQSPALCRLLPRVLPRPWPHPRVLASLLALSVPGLMSQLLWLARIWGRPSPSSTHHHAHQCQWAWPPLPQLPSASIFNNWSKDWGWGGLPLPLRLLCARVRFASVQALLVPGAPAPALQDRANIQHRARPPHKPRAWVGLRSAQHQHRVQSWRGLSLSLATLQATASQISFRVDEEALALQSTRQLRS